MSDPIRAGPRGPYFAHTTMASSVFGAVARAKEFFESDFWKGPKPKPETIYLVTLVGDERSFRVAGQAVEKWRDSKGPNTSIRVRETVP
jgi:hypothetical protein